MFFTQLLHTHKIINSLVAREIMSSCEISIFTTLKSEIITVIKYLMRSLAGEPLPQSCVSNDYVDLEESPKLKTEINFNFGRRTNQWCALQVTKIPRVCLERECLATFPSP